MSTNLGHITVIYEDPNLAIVKVQDGDADGLKIPLLHIFYTVKVDADHSKNYLVIFHDLDSMANLPTISQQEIDVLDNYYVGFYTFNILGKKVVWLQQGGMNKNQTMTIISHGPFLVTD